MTGDHKKPAVVIGGGSWGCAIAAALLQAGTPAQLLVRSPDTADALARGVCRQLSDAPVLPPLDARTEDSILDTAGLVFVVLPVSATANCLEQLAGRLAPDVPVALCAKGLMATADTAGMLMPELAGHLLPDHHAVVFSGPTFADEVASGKPAAITAASHNAAGRKHHPAGFRRQRAQGLCQR
jgi:glycerol-3-phosphate dehydrogenase (NAD(P)+)